jgi:glycosidase
MSLYDPDVLDVFADVKASAGGTGAPFPASIAAAPAATPFPSPIDWRDQWIYFLLVDRFNNPNGPPHTPPYDGTFNGFQGGSYRGVQAQLPYLRELGAGAIWLSPVLENLPFANTYHGYDIHNFLRAEPRFAEVPANADDELRALVDAAHALGIYVIFDIVLNHTGDTFAYDGYPDSGPPPPVGNVVLPLHWRDATGTPTFPSIEGIAAPPAGALVWPSELQRDAFYRREGAISTSDGVIGDFASLKQLMTSDANVQNYLIRAYQYAIARFDCDGFRVDTLRYLQGSLPQLFGNSMREFALSIGKKNFFTFGEVFDADSEDDIARFIGRNTTTTPAGDELVGIDAALDYPLFFVIKDVLKGFAPPQALVDMYSNRKRIEEPIVSSHGDATRFFVTFLDNHDNKARFYFVDPTSPHAYDDQTTAAIACLYGLQGIPCLYYGTEQQLHGAGTVDELVREALWGKIPNPPAPFDPTNPFYVAVQSIARARAQAPALRYGRQYFRPISGDGLTFAVSTLSPGVVAYSRILNDEEVVVIVNVTTTAQDLLVIVDTTLNPSGTAFRVAYSNKAAPTAPDPVGTVGTGGALTIRELDGTTSSGPVQAVRVHLQEREAQILSR